MASSQSLNKKSRRAANGSTPTPSRAVWSATSVKVSRVELAIWDGAQTLRLTSVVVWEVWTNGLYQSTLHRVVHRGSSYRYVCPLYSKITYWPS